LIGISEVPDLIKEASDLTTRLDTAGVSISAIDFSKRLIADVDAWAKAHGTVRFDAVRQLVQLGLSATSNLAGTGSVSRDAVEIEDIAVKEIRQLLDPSLPANEGERRIRRLTEGPPEFSYERVDLPKPRK
jgi:L-serine deaminase